MYIVSDCLMGRNCKYNGGNNRNEKVIQFLNGKKYIKVCPECTGGLPTPRPPAEYADDGSERIINCEGKDVTFFFEMGAQLEIMKIRDEAVKIGEPVEGAILKGKSPSCGKGEVYDGTFSGTLREGNGCFADKLIKQNIPVYTEKEIEEIKEK